MNSSEKSHKEMPSDDNSEDSKKNSDDSFRESSSSESEYSESSIIGSDSEFGPEETHIIPNKGDELASDKLSLMAWVPTFKERVDEIISRLLNDSLKFCISGTMNAPPIISISLLKVRDED